MTGRSAAAQRDQRRSPELAQVVAHSKLQAGAEVQRLENRERVLVQLAREFDRVLFRDVWRPCANVRLARGWLPAVDQYLVEAVVKPCHDRRDEDSAQTV